MSKQSMTPLYDAMVQAIDLEYKYDSGEEIADKVERLKFYCRVAQNHGPEIMVREIRLRADREATKLWKQQKRKARR